MSQPPASLTLELPQVEELLRQFSTFRHDVNGCLSLVVAATELIRYNPDVVKRMANTLVEQPPRIAGKTREFVEECERMMGLRPAGETSWHAPLRKRSYGISAAPTVPQTISPEDAKLLHSDYMAMNKEFALFGFTLAGQNALTEFNAAHGTLSFPHLLEQFGKLAQKFELTISRLEQVLKIEESGSRRMVSGTPSGPVTLSPEQVTLLRRRCLNLERDILEQLEPLIELGLLAKVRPSELQIRAAEFASQPPKISADITSFGVEFDKTFGIRRNS